MLFERQRLLLALLDALNTPIDHMDFQKLLFLYTRECEEKPSYEFIPYRFGGFSFTSHADKRKLVDAGLLENEEKLWRLTKAGQDASRQRTVASLSLAAFCQKYKNLRGLDLVAEVYRRFPYYATRSEIVNKVLTDKESRNSVAQAKPVSPGPGLLTIGYEQKCLETYLNQLLQAGVTLLCDVRRNPLSRKYGFSKGTLQKSCEGIGIRYEHLPELGIASDQRWGLETQADYDTLFEVYERKSLPQQTEALDRIRNWILKDHQRVALTCFELLPHQCHRHCVAEVLEKKGKDSLTAIHL